MIKGHFWFLFNEKAGLFRRIRGNYRPGENAGSFTYLFKVIFVDDNQHSVMLRITSRFLTTEAAFVESNNMGGNHEASCGDRSCDVCRDSHLLDGVGSSMP
jgi:hypothetical protein